MAIIRSIIIVAHIITGIITEGITEVAAITTTVVMEATDIMEVVVTITGATAIITIKGATDMEATATMEVMAAMATAMDSHQRSSAPHPNTRTSAHSTRSCPT